MISMINAMVPLGPKYQVSITSRGGASAHAVEPNVHGITPYADGKGPCGYSRMIRD